MIIDPMENTTILSSRSTHMPDAANNHSKGLLPTMDPSEADDDDEQDCSSLTDSSGDTFHVFTDASVSVAPRSKSTKSGGASAANNSNNNNELYGAERQLLQTERQKLEAERLKLAEERKQLEKERRRLRARDEETDGVTPTPTTPKLKKKIKDRMSTRSTGDLSSELMSTERLREKEERAKRRAAKRSDVLVNGNVRSKSSDLADMRAASAHDAITTTYSKPTRSQSSDINRSSSQLVKPYANGKEPIGKLNPTANHTLRNRIGGGTNPPEIVLEEESLDIVGEAKKADEAQRMKEKEKRQQEEDTRKQTLEKARQKMQEDRKQRQEQIRLRIAAEEAEAKLKIQRKKDEEAAAAQAPKPVDNSDKARTQRAYSWYSKLAQPGKTAFKKKIALMKNLDIVPEDIDLLPWNGMGTMVNVAKLNALLYQKQS